MIKKTIVCWKLALCYIITDFYGVNTELEVLKKIFQGKDKIPVRLISNHLGYGIDYIRFICKRLKEQDLVKPLQRDWYKITFQGKKELKKRGLIKKSLQKKGLKIKSPVWERVRMKSIPTRVSKNVKLKSNFKTTKGKKLKVGKKIEKAASFLGKLQIS